MKILDVHSHWGTKRGYPLRTEAELAQQKKVWNSEPRYHTEEGMADYFRAQGVRVILDLGFTKYLPLDEVRTHHDYALEIQAQHSDVIHGLWLQIHPSNGDAGVRELERCMRACKGFVGYMVVGAGLGHPCDDPIYAPYYDVSEAVKRPVMILVGYNGGGAGLLLGQLGGDRRARNVLEVRVWQVLAEPVAALSQRLRFAVNPPDHLLLAIGQQVVMDFEAYFRANRELGQAHEHLAWSNRHILPPDIRTHCPGPAGNLQPTRARTHYLTHQRSSCAR